jgi:TonB-dependent receptor
MTSKSVLVLFSIALFLSFFLGAFTSAQTGKGAISGRVADSSGAMLQGARVELQPGGATAVTGQQGEFTISGLDPGDYTVTVNYVGFSVFSAKLSVTPGQVARVDASLKVATKNEEIVVTAERAHGEAEALNRQRESDNILQVLPVEVITSLPNTNIADALGRLPSVTLERDEGEGKYVQIRGAEPRYNNVTIDGMEVASPESVRQIKLDIVPANLVDSVEINKTLSANQDGDAIGGSVNLVTKRAEEKPTLYLNGIGGYTPIVGGRTLSEFDGTVGQRFGESKRLGVLFGASYDWNGRGINDVEPSPTAIQCDPGANGCLNPSPTAPFVATYSGEDVRDYRYYRTRYGFTGDIDYKLGDVSGLYVRLLYSHFDNFGDRWVYSPSVGTWNTPTLTNNDGSMSFNVSIRRPVQVIGSLQAGGKNVIGPWLAVYEFSVSRASSEDHGYSQANFDGTGPALSNLQFAIDPNSHTPKFIPQGGVNVYDPSQYTLTSLDVSRTYSPQLNLAGAASVQRNYNLAGHFGTFEFGGKIRNAHKFQDSLDPVYDSVTNPPMTNFLGSFSNPSYYDGAYPGSFTQPTADFGKIRSYFNANVNDPNSFKQDFASSAQNQYPNNFDLIERVTAGYLMNTLQFRRVRLQTGVRFEGTQENLLGYQVFFDSGGFLCPGPNPSDPFCQGITNPIGTLKKNSSYLDVFPSAQLRFELVKDSAIRVSYGRGIARPDFGDLPPTFNSQGNGNEVDIGNPNLVPTRANNFDILFEQYLKPLGVIQAGVFYKDISQPIFSERTQISAAFAAQNPQFTPYVGENLVQPINGSAAHLVGFEVAYQQHMTFLPGFLSGFGLSANYSYTSSKAHGGPNRTDDPALQRQAPSTGNFSPTYDRGRLSARLGVTYNGPNIFQYAYSNLNSDGTPNPVPLGKTGPNGDIYLLQHTQVDAQASFRMYKGLRFIFAGLNLSNEVFGFYAGSPLYPIQREYYKPSYEFGLRYTMGE